MQGQESAAIVNMAGDKICSSKYVENGEKMTDKDEPDVNLHPEDEVESSPLVSSNPPEFQFSTAACYTCNGYYGPCFGEPVCATCHAFLFPDDGLFDSAMFSEKIDDEDSGNDEPLDLYYVVDRKTSHQQLNSSQNSSPLVSSPSDASDQNAVPCPHVPPINCQSSRSNPELNNAANFCRRPVQALPNRNLNALDLNIQVRNDHENENIPVRDVGAFQQHDVSEDELQSPEDVYGDEEVVQFENIVNPRRRSCLDFPEGGEPSRPRNLTERLDMLANYKHIEQEFVGEPGYVERLPPEVLLSVFRYLDDVSLWCAANVCRRWYGLLSTHITPRQWRQHVKTRWPLYKAVGTVTDWYKVYDQLASSVPCKTCLSQTCLAQSCTYTRPPRVCSSLWRWNRLRIELKGLRIDPPEGIQARPLDQMSSHWQATITGPAGSPYEGGLFYLYLLVPYSYPMRPPIVRFLTKILHPNVSRHGDVGIDSIQHNWSLALTISKVLISVQSLLTDPYCQVCMEPELGDMYMNNRERFEKIARAWTRKYAMHNTLTPP